jgi:hypothetical protein
MDEEELKVCNHNYSLSFLWLVYQFIGVSDRAELQGEQGDPMKNFQKLMGMETKTNDDPDED